MNDIDARTQLTSLTTNPSRPTVLIAGNGGREHALAWKLAQQRPDSRIVVAPGNAGTAEEFGWNHSDKVGPMSVSNYAELAESLDADLTVVGPETLLAEGIVDEFLRRRLTVFGPTAAAARVETSKLWTKALLEEADVETAPGRLVESLDEALEVAATYGYRCAVKADGLASGKGTVVCGSAQEVTAAWARLRGTPPTSMQPILVEQYFDGEELSVFVLTDGLTVCPFGAAQDHKRRSDGDTGPNTGGMGAYSPVPYLADLEDWAYNAADRIQRTLRKRNDAALYAGVLYLGAIRTSQGPKILELNCRFGDPETQTLLPRLESDLYDYFSAVATRTLATLPAPAWNDAHAVCVVVADPAYPSLRDSSWRVVSGIGDVQPEALIFHGGTQISGDTGALVSSAGRVLGMTGVADDLAAARNLAYQAVGAVAPSGFHARGDIATRQLALSGDDQQVPAQVQSSARRQQVGAIVERIILEALSLLKESELTDDQVQTLNTALAQLTSVVSTKGSDDPRAASNEVADALASLQTAADEIARILEG